MTTSTVWTGVLGPWDLTFRWTGSMKHIQYRANRMAERTRNHHYIRDVNFSEEKIINGDIFLEFNLHVKKKIDLVI